MSRTCPCAEEAPGMCRVRRRFSKGTPVLVRDPMGGLPLLMIVGREWRRKRWDRTHRVLCWRPDCRIGGSVPLADVTRFAGQKFKPWRKPAPRTASHS